MATFRKSFYATFLIGLTLATFTAAMLVVIRFPSWQSSIASIRDPKDRITIENEILKNIIQMLGGAFLMLGVYFTWRNFRLSQEGQITQRFNNAIEHLGSEKPEIRLGGIYALARIAQDSSKDHAPVMNVLSSYVREKTKRTAEEPVAPEVQAILTMIATRVVEHEAVEDKIDLNGAYIPGVNLRGAQLERVCFDGANISRATLENARLREATFRTAVMEDANLRGADLRDADLTGADLHQATLRGANLAGASIFGAQLAGATLLHADLSKARYAVKEQIESAITDDTTKLPTYTTF